MNVQLLNDHCRLQAEHEELVEAVKDFVEKREAVENSHSDAFNHQGKRVQRRQHELEKARERMKELVSE